MYNTIKHIQRRNDRATRNAQKHVMSAIYQTFEECQAILDRGQQVSRSEVPEATDDNAEGLAFSEDFAGIYADR